MVPLSGYELGLVLLSALLHASWNAAAKRSESPTAFLLTMEAASLVLYLPVLIFGFHLSDLPPSLWVWIAGSGRSRRMAGSSFDHWVPLGAVFAYLTLLTTVAYSLIDKGAMQLLDAAEWAGPAPRALVYMGLFEVGYVPLFSLLAARSLKKGELMRVARSEWGTALVGAVFGICSYALILEAMRTAQVSYVVAVRQSSVLFAVALGVFFLRERPGRVRVLGTVATIAGVATISVYS